METLDKYDRAILNELQTNGRLTNAELALRVGLSAAPCWRRVRALESNGFITGYRAVINRRLVGLGVLAFVRLDAERNTGDGTRVLEQAITKLPEVISCHYISGTGTFELQVVAQDLDAFSRFALGSLMNLPNVKDIQTSFSLGEIKSSGALPLGHLAQALPAAARDTPTWAKEPTSATAASSAPQAPPPPAPIRQKSPRAPRR